MLDRRERKEGGGKAGERQDRGDKTGGRQDRMDASKCGRGCVLYRIYADRRDAGPERCRAV